MDRWRKANPERFKASLQKYRARNKAKLNAASKAWRQKNAERVKENSRVYRASNRAVAALRNHVGAITPQVLALAALKANGCCYCGSHERIEVDHKIPKSRGGPRLDVNNLQWLCRKCNHAKGSMKEDEFFLHIELLYHKRFGAGL